jgi:hypothetical protein
MPFFFFVQYNFKKHFIPLSRMCGAETTILLYWDSQEWYGWKQQMNSCPLSVSQKKNESRHLVFWLLETLTNLRVWERRLIA